MKGGKGGRPRRPVTAKPVKAKIGAKPKKDARQSSVAPKKGSQKRPHVGGHSSTGEDY